MTTAKRFKQVLDRSAQGIPALIGRLNSDGSYTVTASGRANEIYARLYGDENRVITVLNHRVSAYANLPIRVRRADSGLYEVIGVDGIEAEQFAGASVPSLNIPRLTGSLITTVWETSQLQPARAHPANNSNDLWVYVEKAIYGDSIVGGLHVDLADAVGAIATGKAAIVLSLNTSINSITATNGTDTDVDTAITLEDVMAITIPSGDIRLAAYIIQSGATTLPTSALAIDGNYYYDLRTFIGVPTVSSGSGGSSQWMGAQFNHYDFCATVGIVATQTLSGQTYPYMVYNSSNANGDTLKIIAHMATGNYEAKIVVCKDYNRAIMDVKVNGTVNTSVDMYSASSVYNHEIVITFTIASDGEQTFEFVANGKNASSSGYFLTITRMWVYPS